MTRILKYLKPYWLQIVLAIALLFVQAYADLALPDYLARIVNTGIQQGGVANAVPPAIRQSELTRLLLFLSPDEQAQVQAAYTLVQAGAANYDQYRADYPALAKEPIVILNDQGQQQIDALNPVLGKAFIIVNSIEQALTNPEKTAALSAQFGFDLSKLPAGVDVFALLGKLPAAQRAQMTTAINQKFAGMGTSLIVQSAAGAVKAEYAALGADTSRLQTGYIVQTGGLMLLVSLLSGACTIVVGLLAARTAAGLARDLRQLVFQKVESFSNTEFDRFSTASLITRSTNDITQIQMVVIMMLRMVFYAPIIGVGGVIRAMQHDVSMWWIIALAVVILMGLVFTVFSVALPKFRLIQTLVDRLNLVMRENLSGMMVIRAFNQQPFELRRFDQANQDLTGNLLFINRVMVIMMPMMMLIMNGLSLLIIWVGAHQVAEAHMQVGDMMAFLQYSMQIVMAFLMLSMMFIMLPRASVSAGRVADVLETAPVIEDPAQPKRLPSRVTGQLEFRQVSFRYPGAEEDVLHDISFTAQPGQTTALIGSTGCGKSTIVNLIPRFYDVTSGAICLDGLDIREVTQHDLRERIGYVPQKGLLFSGTIDSNLRYADEHASDARVREAIDTAQAREFIAARPEGLAAEIAQAGANVSGGQKQRLSIARALVKQPPVYLFDDSFSALDFRTDAALRQAMKARTSDSTLLIVTQRVSTIKTAEKIIVLDEGRIVGQGTHRQLMADCETYREIALSQLGQEELA